MKRTTRANETVDDLVQLLRSHRVLSFDESDRVADEIERLRAVVGEVERVLRIHNSSQHDYDSGMTDGETLAFVEEALRE